MTGGVKGHGRVANPACFGVFDAVSGDLAKAVVQNRQSAFCGQIPPMTGARVIGVAMGDQRRCHGAPGINMKIAGGAIDALGCEGQNRVACHVSEAIAGLSGGNCLGVGAKQVFNYSLAKSDCAQRGGRIIAFSGN